jgi:hypothetical protein
MRNVSQTKGLAAIMSGVDSLLILQVKCIFSESNPFTCNFCARYSFQCVINTVRKRRGPQPRVISHRSVNAPKKQLKTGLSPVRYRSPTQGIDEDSNLTDRVSGSSTMSDHEEWADSSQTSWGKDKDESAFIAFLGQLSTVEFELPMSCPS